MLYAIWYKIYDTYHDICYIIYSVRYKIYAIWYKLHDAMLFDIFYMKVSIWYKIYGI